VRSLTRSLLNGWAAASGSVSDALLQLSAGTQERFGRVIGIDSRGRCLTTGCNGGRWVAAPELLSLVGPTGQKAVAALLPRRLSDVPWPLAASGTSVARGSVCVFPPVYHRTNGRFHKSPFPNTGWHLELPEPSSPVPAHPTRRSCFFPASAAWLPAITELPKILSAFLLITLLIHLNRPLHARMPTSNRAHTIRACLVSREEFLNVESHHR